MHSTMETEMKSRSSSLYNQSKRETIQISVNEASISELDCLLLLQNRSCDKVLIRTDNMEEVTQWDLEYIPREENSKVDSITKIAFERNEG
ncbi:hypothetical protein Golob_006080 [Gossypium lobatum]|uniref:RNase H type-1 domain-containing protein n=1 Tax=Gossypium lobatum TaxID=34289 RepID=A0A7J8MV53_9ROSI|nr:hypothetical protein [Gossypium lobatum]